MQTFVLPLYITPQFEASLVEYSGSNLPEVWAARLEAAWRQVEPHFRSLDADDLIEMHENVGWSSSSTLAKSIELQVPPHFLESIHREAVRIGVAVSLLARAVWIQAHFPPQ